MAEGTLEQISERPRSSGAKSRGLGEVISVGPGGARHAVSILD